MSGRAWAAAALASCAALSGCREEPLVPKPAAPVERARLRDQVAPLMDAGCGSCHTSTRATAKPKALAVFDLVNPLWIEAMKTEQLSGIPKRFGKRGKPEGLLVRRYVAAELARRNERR